MREIQLVKLGIKWMATIDLILFYKELYRNINMLGYEVREKKYKHEETTKGRNNIVWDWECTKVADNYCQLKLGINAFIDSEKKVEIQKGTARVEVSKCNLDFSIKPTIVVDWKDEWEKNIILKNVKWFYEKYIYKKMYNTHQDKVLYEAYRLENLMKDFLGIPGYMP